MQRHVISNSKIVNLKFCAFTPELIARRLSVMVFDMLAKFKIRESPRIKTIYLL